MSRTYRHGSADEVDIATTGERLRLEVDDLTTVSVSIDGTASADYALEADLGDGEYVEFAAFTGATDVKEVLSLAAQSIRLSVTSAAAAGETADVKLAAA